MVPAKVSLLAPRARKAMRVVRSIYSQPKSADNQSGSSLTSSGSPAFFRLYPTAAQAAAIPRPIISARIRSVLQNSLIKRPPTKNKKPPIKNRSQANPRKRSFTKDSVEVSIVVKPSQSLRHGRGFRPSVEFVDLLLVAFLDHTPSQLHGGRQHAVVGGEFIGHEQDSLQLFEAR